MKYELEEVKVLFWQKPLSGNLFGHFTCPVLNPATAQRYISTTNVHNMVCERCYQFAWRNPEGMRPRAHEARQLFHIQNIKPEHCEGYSRNITQSGNMLVVFAVFCDPDWKWLSTQCDKRWRVSHPEYVCTNVHCGTTYGLLQANSRGELVCESCYCYDRAINGGVRGSGQLIAPTVPIKQDPDHPKHVDRKCEDLNCPKVAPSDK